MKKVIEVKYEWIPVSLSWIVSYFLWCFNSKYFILELGLVTSFSIDFIIQIIAIISKSPKSKLIIRPVGFTCNILFLLSLIIFLFLYDNFWAVEIALFAFLWFILTKLMDELSVKKYLKKRHSNDETIKLITSGTKPIPYIAPFTAFLSTVLQASYEQYGNQSIIINILSNSSKLDKFGHLPIWHWLITLFIIMIYLFIIIRICQYLPNIVDRLRDMLLNWIILIMRNV